MKINTGQTETGKDLKVFVERGIRFLAVRPEKVIDGPRELQIVVLTLLLASAYTAPWLLVVRHRVSLG